MRQILDFTEDAHLDAHLFLSASTASDHTCRLLAAPVAVAVAVVAVVVVVDVVVVVAVVVVVVVLLLLLLSGGKRTH